MNDVNLDTDFLPAEALTAEKYYTVQSYSEINPNNANDIEAALALGKEVVWDFRVANTDTHGEIWRPCRMGQASCPNGVHAMLIIGYDRRDPDPKNHYFLVKNSWGPTPNEGGYTKISYDYLQYGTDAVTIDAVQPPQPWYELAFIGRWNLDFDGWKGLLDIYHLPGVAQFQLSLAGVTTTDRRIGTFYDTDGRAFKVNGYITGQTIEFHIDGANPNARWDQLGGREFRYTIVHHPARDLMAGAHKDPDGRIYGGYASKRGWLPSGVGSTNPLRISSYLGQWASQFNNTRGVLTFFRQDDSFLSPAERDAFSGLVGDFRLDSRRYVARALVNKADLADIRISIPELLGAPGLDGGGVFGHRLNHENGVVAGSALYADGTNTGFVMIRTTTSPYVIWLPLLRL